MMRSTSAGPRSTRTSPSTTVARTNAATASRRLSHGSRFPDGANEQRFLRRQLRRDRLPGVEAMDEHASARLGARREGTGQQAHQARESVARRALGEPCRIDDKARAKRQARVEGAARDIGPCDQRLDRKAQHQPGEGTGPQASGRWRQQAKTGASRCRDSDGPDGQIGRIAARQQHPKK